jgi:single-strand DNA-binding protein
LIKSPKNQQVSGVNKVILVGNLGKDPEIRYTDTNVARVSFTLATTEVHKDKNGNRTEHTEWHNIVMWRQLAQNAEKLLRKGMQVYIEGRIQSRQWNDKEGQKRSITEINADQFVLLQKREQEKHAHNEGDTPIDHNPPY